MQQCASWPHVNIWKWHQPLFVWTRLITQILMIVCTDSKDCSECGAAFPHSKAHIVRSHSERPFSWETVFPSPADHSRRSTVWSFPRSRALFPACKHSHEPGYSVQNRGSLVQSSRTVLLSDPEPPTGAPHRLANADVTSVSWFDWLVLLDRLLVIVRQKKQVFFHRILFPSNFWAT